MRPKKDDHPPRARSSSSGVIRPRCRSSISVQPSSGSVRTTVTNSYSPRPPERLQDGARHQDAVFADRKGDVHDLVFFFLGIRHAFDRQVLEPDDGGELTAEYRLVEAERLLGVTGEIQVRVQRGRPLPPTRASAPSYALFSSAIELTSRYLVRVAPALARDRLSRVLVPADRLVGVRPKAKDLSRGTRARLRSL
jgi:hypothetical protein